MLISTSASKSPILISILIFQDMARPISLDIFTRHINKNKTRNKTSNKTRKICIEGQRQSIYTFLENL